MAEQLIDAMHEQFDAEAYKDEHRRLVLKLIEAKATGEEIEAEDVPEAEAPDDLAAALQASLDERAHSGRRRRGAGKGQGKRKPAERREG